MNARTLIGFSSIGRENFYPHSQEVKVSHMKVRGLTAKSGAGKCRNEIIDRTLVV